MLFRVSWQVAGGQPRGTVRYLVQEVEEHVAVELSFPSLPVTGEFKDLLARRGTPDPRVPCSNCRILEDIHTWLPAIKNELQR